MRECGILCHISSLPSPCGIGTLGKEAYKFVDFLRRSGQGYWQILPVGPTGFGDSPYQSYSAFAGNPLFIDIDMLISGGLLEENDKDVRLLRSKDRFADFGQLFSFKRLILAKAYTAFSAKGTDKSSLSSPAAKAGGEIPPGTAGEKTVTVSQMSSGKRQIPPCGDMADFTDFCRKNAWWLEDYALFMSLKYHFKQVMWTLWEDKYRLRDKETLREYSAANAEDIARWKFMQYEFFLQYGALKKYANKRGVKIYGDMPIYVSMDSSDIWANPQMFMLDKDCRPLSVAGCPPDDFAPTGQLWGNPLYDWDKMEKDSYKWWVTRVKYSSELFDLTRIDHFRGFESFYAIPAEDETAEHGKWLKGPGMKLFKAIKSELPGVKLVAEDLGFLTEDVVTMLKEAGYPGMKVLEFGFGGDDSGYLPHNYDKNSVVYIGTHDNETALGWYKGCGKETKKRIRRYLGLSKKAEDKKVVAHLIRTAYAGVSDLCIIQLQDLLMLDNTARMNIPSTIGGSNWQWRFPAGVLTDKLAATLKKLARTYYREARD
ncbi:MAG: 4-alpha-glucanotransferase [Ruminococcus sp.]|nr:4-alpha-glucanotransferase [Ruminococcus sp.]